jgi:hypothetical protein
MVASLLPVYVAVTVAVSVAPTVVKKGRAEPFAMVAD